MIDNRHWLSAEERKQEAKDRRTFEKIHKNEPTIAEMIQELKSARWRKHQATVWESPEGGYFRGPYGAWRAMKADANSTPPAKEGK